MEKVHSLIVGGSRGMGKALVRTLTGEGHLVSVIGRRRPVENGLPPVGVRYWSVDLLDQGGLSTVLEEILRQHGKLKNLVFFQRYRGEGDDWAGELDTSLTATKSVIERLSGEFASGGEKSIVIVSSIVSLFVDEGCALGYQVAKAALTHLMRYYAVTLGSKRIRVNCVSPCSVIKEESKEFYLRNQKLYNLYKKVTPLARMGTSEDVAQVISFLCSQKASFITGQNIVVDGGLSLQSQESLVRKLGLGKGTEPLRSRRRIGLVKR